MSMCHWICQGIGIRTNDLYPHLNSRKCAEFLNRMIPRKNIDEEIDPNSFNVSYIDEYFYGEPFDNLGELLCHADDTGTMTYGDNGDSEYYFYYIPSYPWERRGNEPSSIQEVHDRIIDAVLVLCDMSRAEVDALIDDDIYDYGCG